MTRKPNEERRSPNQRIKFSQILRLLQTKIKNSGKQHGNSRNQSTSNQGNFKN